MAIHVLFVAVFLQACFGQQLQQPQQQLTSPSLPPGQAASFNTQTGQMMDLFRGATASFSQALINLINYKLRWLSQVAANVPGGQGDTSILPAYPPTSTPTLTGNLPIGVPGVAPGINPQASLYQQPQPTVPQAPVTAPALPAPVPLPVSQSPATAPQVAYPPNQQVPPAAQQMPAVAPALQAGYQNPPAVATAPNPPPAPQAPVAPAIQPGLPPPAPATTPVAGR